MSATLFVVAFALVTATVVGLSILGFSAAWSEWRVKRREQPIRLRVAHRAALSDDAFTLTLVSRWGRLPAFAPGQHILVRISSGTTPGLSRAYSLAAWERKPKSYVLGIKRATNGSVSRWLFDHAHPGCVLLASGPRGSFRAPTRPAAETLVLVAGGIGITPFRAMLHAWSQSDTPGRAVLHFSGHSEEQLYYHAEFVALAAAKPWFEYRPRLTGQYSQWRGEVGRLTAEDVLASITEIASTRVFVCAGAAMEEAIVAGLFAAGLTPDRVHRESFGLQAAANDIRATITWGERSFPFDGAPTLLHALTANGIEVPTECRAGECGRCRLAVVSGAARDLLSGREETTSILACCGVPITDIALRPIPKS